MFLNVYEFRSVDMLREREVAILVHETGHNIAVRPGCFLALLLILLLLLLSPKTFFFLFSRSIFVERTGQSSFAFERVDSRFVMFAERSVCERVCDSLVSARGDDAVQQEAVGDTEGALLLDVGKQFLERPSGQGEDRVVLVQQSRITEVGHIRGVLGEEGLKHRILLE